MCPDEGGLMSKVILFNLISLMVFRLNGEIDWHNVTMNSTSLPSTSPTPLAADLRPRHLPAHDQPSPWKDTPPHHRREDELDP
jgi:hypothetical protein